MFSSLRNYFIISLVLHLLLLLVFSIVKLPAAPPALRLSPKITVDTSKPKPLPPPPKPKAPPPPVKVPREVPPPPLPVTRPQPQPVHPQPQPPKPNIPTPVQPTVTPKLPPVTTPAAPKPAPPDPEEGDGGTVIGAPPSPENGGGYTGGGGPVVQSNPPKNATISHGGMPKYPKMSLENNEEGTVTLSVTIGASGKVSTTDVTGSSGHAALDNEAKRAVAKWHGTPSKYGGRPTVTVRFTFKDGRVGGG